MFPTVVYLSLCYFLREFFSNLGNVLTIMLRHGVTQPLSLGSVLLCAQTLMVVPYSFFLSSRQYATSLLIF